MATTLIHEPQQTIERADDPFHDPLLGAIAVVFIVLALVIVMLTGLIIWGVEYGTPAWNSNSYPPPVVHRW
jgi:hypothetical protein